MTVTTTPPPGRRSWRCRCSAARAISSSPSTTSPSRSAARTRSPSPSKAKPRSCPARRHRRGQRLDVGGSTAVVDVAAVRLRRARGHLGAQAPEDLGGRAEGRAVGAVQQHVKAGEVEALEAHVQLAQVVLQRAVQRADPPDRGAGRGRVLERALDGPLGVVVELVAVGAEELDPVVPVGVVRGREHDGQVEPVAAREQRRGGRGQDPAQQRVPARGGDAGSGGGLEHGARLAGVAQHQHLRPRGLAQAGGGPGERQGELGRDQLARHPADTIGAEQLARHRGARLVPAPVAPGH